MSNNELNNINTKIVSKIVDDIHDAVGDGIKEDIHKLKTYNSRASRIWDLINTNLLNSFDTIDCMSYDSMRGPWQMVMIYEKETGFLFTFMREKRFVELQNGTVTRKNMHYIDMLTRHLNSDLISETYQLRLFPISYNDEELLGEKINILLKKLKEDGAVLNRYVNVLFDSSNYQLNSIRATMIDSYLNIVYEQDWTEFINAQESIVAEKVARDIAPTKQLTLTKKAIARKKSSPTRKLESDKENEI